MFSAISAVIGACAGVVFGVTALVRERRRHRGRPVQGIPESGIAFRHARGSDGIERYVLLRAAACSFPALVLTFSIYGLLQEAFRWTPQGGLIFGLAWGVGGLSFGVASAVIARRAA